MGSEMFVRSLLVIICKHVSARSPVFSHLSASLTGISTIRSCGLEQRLISEFDALQNVHSGVWQLAQAANCALGLWLDCVSASFVACVTFTFIGLYDCKYCKILFILGKFENTGLLETV